MKDHITFGLYSNPFRYRYILFISVIAALGGFLFGYDWVVIGGAKPFYESYFNLTSSFQIGWAMSNALVGCLIVAAIAFYAMSLAPVTWVIISEIFPNRIRGAAMSVSVFALWTASLVLTYTFPILNQGLGEGSKGTAFTFGIYAVICIIGFIFIHKKLPETKEKSLEELEKVLDK